MSTSITRSDFLKTAALAGAALGITATGVSTAQAEDARDLADELERMLAHIRDSRPLIY